ncbi:MAG TPA: hypothetical protein VGM66_08960 [Candidatus Udaeobacter sp.]|jgi:hypothetical protein
MHNIGSIQVYSPRWQCIVMLFAVLDEVRGGLTKAAALERIFERRWFDFQPEDRLPYPSNKHTSREPRWKTVIAWARKDGVEHHLMQHGPVNNWDLEGIGRDVFAAIAKACKEHRIDVRHCYLWSSAFKQRIDISYTLSPADAKRPINLYEGDWVTRNIDFLLAELLARSNA